MSTENCDNKSFGTIRNNTALKLSATVNLTIHSFETIRNMPYTLVLEPFETTQL